MSVEEIGREPFVYMCNKDIEAKLFDHPKIQPMLGHHEQLPNTTHGLNQFQTYNNAVVFSALNPPPAQYKFLQEVAGIDPDEVKAAGYRQSVYQAAMRISLRNPTNRDMKKVVVMDKPTAEFLQKMCPGSRIQKFNGIDLDSALENTTRKEGRPSKWASAAERQKAYRERKKTK